MEGGSGSGRGEHPNREELAILQTSPIEAQALTGVEMHYAAIEALQMASDASSMNSLMVVIKLNHVSQRYHMGIPSRWAKHQNLDKSQNIILRMAGKSWNVGFYKRPHGGSFTRGWKKFVTDNCLEPFDVCLFNMSIERNEAGIIDVCIFRVPKSRTVFRVNACSLVDSMSSTSNMATIASTEEVSDSARTKKPSLAIASHRPSRF